MRHYFASTSTETPTRRWAGIGAVVGLHGIALGVLWQTDFRSTMAEAGTLFVALIDQAQPKPEPPQPKIPVKIERPRPAPLEPQQLVANVVATEPSDYVAPAPPAITAAEPVGAPPAGSAAPLQPVNLPELSVVCPERAPPSYPPMARRLGEQGLVVLRVNLDEHGKVTDVFVNTSSGSARLDEAAAQAVKRWQCKPANRDGRAVPAVALQPFNFVLDRT